MKQIHKYSTGLIFILFIIIGLDGIGCLANFIFYSCKSALIWFLVVNRFLHILALILNIFFFILSVFYYIGKFKELEDFAKCDFFYDNNNNNFKKIWFYFYNSKKL